MPRPRHASSHVNDTQKMTLDLACRLGANCHGAEVGVYFLKVYCYGRIYENISKKRAEKKIGSNSSSQTSDTNHDEFSFSLSLCVIPNRAVPNGVHLMQLGLNYLLHYGPAILGFGLVDLFLLGLQDIVETGSMSVTIT